MSSRVLENPDNQVRVLRSIIARPVLLVVVISSAIFVPALVFGVPSNLDLTNHLRFALPFYDGIRSGNFYPGWLAESNAGYGDASFRFYPPALYYLLSATRVLTGSWYDGMLLAFGSLFVMGAIGVYLWARSLFTPRIAVCASILFTLAPYHLNQFYQATMLAEFAACSVLPFVFWYVERICRKQSAGNVAGLAALYALLIFTHLPLTVLGSLALTIYAFLRLDKTIWKKSILFLAAGVTLGLLASACYWVTMIAEKSWIRADVIDPLPFVDYRKNFIFSTFSPDNLNVWWMNILVLFTFAMFGPGLILLHRGTRKKLGWNTVSLAILLTVTFLMSTILAAPVWHLIRPLQETQFPWRWLGIVSMFGAIVAAAAIPEWRRVARGRLRPVCLAVMSGILISVAFSFSHIIREANFLSPSEFNKALAAIPGSNSVSQWLPVWASDHPQAMDGQIVAPERAPRVELWEPERRVFTVAPGPERPVRIRTFYYPHWKATAAGKELSLTPAKDGALSISLPPQAVTVTLQFVEPTRARGAAIATAIGWLLIAFLFFAGYSTRNSHFQTT
ncbi:MAG TPA: 6-pyruvoyl-tetrahydropterin synthase-related protein [Pyrinomonadaceae bacterium]|jgi:hypothetical protein|nr:6-pyruvoyl-tetrahydropterin synthase-related protein [Pyrinomonadaceae bacterium]